MYFLSVKSNSNEFLNYLKNECISFDDNFSFSFKSETNCVDIISRYFLYIFREDSLSKYQKDFSVSDDELCDLDLIIPSKDSIDILREIKSRIASYFSEFNMFHYDVVLTFRLNDQKKKIDSLVFFALEQISLLKVSDSNLVDLKKIVSFSDRKLEKVIIDFSFSNILVYNGTSLIFSEHKMNEDFVLSQLITLNPHNLYIKRNCFSSESEEIIDFVFGERSIFYENSNELFED